MSPLAALLLCALAGCAGGEKVELRFAPTEGSRVRRTIEVGDFALRTLDEYRKIGAGRPLLLRRQFEEIRPVGPLAGTSVVYTWIPEEGAYGKYYDAREASESALRGLAEDLDLRALLPAGPVAVGDAWSVPGASLRDVFAPAGLLDPSPGTGDGRLVLASVRAEAGRSLATIEVSVPGVGDRGTLVWDLGAKRAASFVLKGVAWRIESVPPQGQK